MISAVHGFQFSAFDVQKDVLEAIRKNDTTYFIFDNYKGYCDAYEPKMPDFTATGRRISEIKCLEYIWELKKRENATERAELCEMYVINQVKKGNIPEYIFTINSPVIFGGRHAVAREFPHMGAIGWRARNTTKMWKKWVFKCGGTLISKNFLLTAAHCSKISLKGVFDIVGNEPEVVRLGLQVIEDNEFLLYGDPVDIEIKRFIVHPMYDPPKKYFDIGLIELVSEVKFMSNIQPACLWSYQNFQTLGKNGTITGWGSTEADSHSYALQVAVVDIIDTPQCDLILQPYRNRNWRGLRSHQMCAGILEGGVDTCQGDSGGPLQVKIPLDTDDHMYWVLGITSFGIGCGRINQPGVYSRVSSFIDWIEEHVWK
ncbi:unnamed protein product, partial [Brenthis ino]